jgi:hypothetical protein
MHQHSHASEIPRVSKVVEWFGYVPDFHDAEIVEIVISASRTRRLVINAFNNTGKIDARGFYVSDRHAAVTILMDDVRFVEISGVNPANEDTISIVSDLDIEAEHGFYKIVWRSSYGMGGIIHARLVRFELKPREVSDAVQE